MGEEHGARGLNDLETKYFVVRHTEPHRACTEPVFDAVALVLEEVQFSGLLTYFEASFRQLSAPKVGSNGSTLILEVPVIVTKRL